METTPQKNFFGGMTKIFKFFLYFFIAWFLIFVLLVAFIFYGLYQIYLPPSQGQAQVVQIEKGQGVEEIASHLEGQKLIRSSFWLKTYAWLANKQDKFQAGQYLIDSSLNIAQIVEMITQGKVIANEVWITIPEGFTFKQMKARLIESGLAQAQLLDNKKIDDFKLQYEFLADAPGKVDLQGFFFPDTYKFEKEVSEKEILTKMLDNFDAKLTGQMRQDIKKQNRTIFEVITLASLLEKEVKTKFDRQIVAGIFLKRIKDGYPLESDASLSYVFDDKKDRHSIDETKVDSSYNTYLYKGLPPTPINNPGIVAIEAAIYPQDSPYYFFLTKPETGEAVFSKNFQEHNVNKAKYLK